MDPTSNVLALRKVVVLLWFPILPLLHWTKGAAPRFLPARIAKWWFEIAYYSHNIVAHASFVLAMICRFDVFYPALLPWGFYYLDNIRETLLRSYSTEIVVRPQLLGGEESATEATSSTIHTDSAGKPTALRLIIERPAGMTVGAGQFVYIRVPELGYEWHPFSLASASSDTNLELMVGVIGDRPHWQRVGPEAREKAKKRAQDITLARRAKAKPGTYVMAEMPVEPPKFVLSSAHATWTFRLEQLLRRRINELAFKMDPERQSDEVKPIKCVVRGPYGSTFNDAFDPKYTGCVVIGAGTGLTAALSVLREIISRRRQSKPTPKYVWFVWATRDANDLLLLWNTMTELLLDALHDGVLRPGGGWTPDSNMLDWLSISIYVTQGSATSIDAFKAEVAPLGERPMHRRKALSRFVDSDGEKKVPEPNVPQPREVRPSTTVAVGVGEVPATVALVTAASVDAGEVNMAQALPLPLVAGVDANEVTVVRVQADPDPDANADEVTAVDATDAAEVTVIDVDAEDGEPANAAPLAVAAEPTEVKPTPHVTCNVFATSPNGVTLSQVVSAGARTDVVSVAPSQSPASSAALSSKTISKEPSPMGPDLQHNHPWQGRREISAWELHDWMAHSHRLLVSQSLDDHGSHILKLLQWVRVYLNRKAGRGRRITIACCGPPSVAQTVADAASRVGGDVQFAAEHV